METTIAIMIYLSILFTGEEYNKDYVYEAEELNHTEIEHVKNDDEQMETVQNEYIPQVDDVTIYKYDEDGTVVVIDPEEMN